MGFAASCRYPHPCGRVAFWRLLPHGRGAVPSAKSEPGRVHCGLALSIPVAALLIAMPRLGGLKELIPAVMAFAVGAAVAVLVEHDQLVQPAQVVLPLLAMVLPGTLLAVGSFDILRGALQAGAARLVGGVHQLLVLALGLVASQAAFALTTPIEQPAEMTRMGAWSPVVGLAVYVLGTCLAFCAPVSAWPTLTIVVYVGWGIQLLTDGLAGPCASTFLAAAVAIVVATGIYPRFGPPPLLTLNPLFRILGIGGLSLLQVTSLTVGNFIGAEVGSAAFTLISVALGLAAGMAVTERMRSRAHNSLSCAGEAPTPRHQLDIKFSQPREIRGKSEGCLEFSPRKPAF